MMEDSQDIKEKLYAIALSLVAAPRTNRVWELAASGPASEAYLHVARMREPAVQHFITQKYASRPEEAAQQIMERVTRDSIRLVTYWDEGYPGLLRHTADPPLVLYCSAPVQPDRAVALVGTRRIDARSAAIARRIGGDLASAGWCVVSGMAIGIDREVHRAALQAGGSTIGVLANGIDVVYPKSNRDLVDAIRSTPGSALISEYPPAIHPGSWTFVRRNRLISGISVATVVIKAGERSGALITARYALEQNRELFVCPGYSFDASYRGSNDLIQKGAQLVADSGDILRELALLPRDREYYRAALRPVQPEVQLPLPMERKEEPRDPLQGALLDLLGNGEQSIDALAAGSGHPVRDVLEAVTLLELAGYVVRNGNFVSKI